jgi:PleD family two-component response regulator
MALCAPEDTPESWLARADAALYQAKAAGRDRWAEKAAKSAAVSATP